MVSSFSPRFRLNYQAPGDNLNTWGLTLNSGVFQLLEDALGKRVAFTLSGAKTLTAANGVEDEARCGFLDVTGGAGGTITAPPVEKLYVVRNGSSGDVILTTGAGASATVKPGEVTSVVCDAANFRKVQPGDFGGERITGVGAPIGESDAVNKAYADGLAFNDVNLPGQGPGTANAALLSDGEVAGWRALAVADVAGAAPIEAPSFVDGLRVSGGITLTGSTKSNVEALASASIDVSVGEFFTMTINANTTFTFTGGTASKAQAFILTLVVANSATPIWPGAVDWPGGVAPALPNGKNVLGFLTDDGGTTWTGYVGGTAFA